MRSGSKGNADDLGLQDMDKNGLTTTIEAKDFGAYGKKYVWDSDVENGTDLVIQGNTSNEWPSEIRKTVRLDIVSENGEERNYESVLSQMNGAANRERSRSNSMRSHRIGGSRDLGRSPVQGPTRAHARQTSAGSGLPWGNLKVPKPALTNLVMRPGLNGSQSSLGAAKPQGIPRSNVKGSQASLGRGNENQLTSANSVQAQELQRESTNGGRFSLSSSSKVRNDADLTQLQTQGLPRGNMNGSQASHANPARGKPSSNGNGSAASASQRISHIYQGSERGVIRDWRGES